MKNRFWLVCLCLVLCCKINGQNISGTLLLTNRLFDVTPESFNALDVSYPWVHSVVLSTGKVAFVYQNYQAGVSDAKLCLYDKDGIVEWTTTIDHGVTDYGVKMEIDGSDNIYLIGASKATEGDWDMFIEKYQSNGTLLYSILYDNGDNLDEIPVDLHVEAGGSVLVTGLCQSDDGTNGVNDDAFVARFSNTLSNQWFEEYDEAAYSDVSVGMEVAGGSIFLAVNSYSNATDRQRCLVKYDQSTGAFQNEVRETGAGREYLTDIATFGNNIVTTGRKKVGSDYSGVLTSYTQTNLVQNWSTNFSGLDYGCRGMKLAVEGDYISWSCEAFDHKNEKMLFNHLVDDAGTLLISNRIEDRALDGITEIRAIEKLGNNFAYLIERGSITGGTTSYVLFYDYGMKSIKKFVLGSDFSPANMHVNGSKISVAGYTIDPEDVNNVQGSCQLISTYEFETDTKIDTTGGDTSEYLSNLLLLHLKPEVLNLSQIDNPDFEFGSFYEFADTSVGDDFEDTTGLDLDSLVLFKAYPGYSSSDTLDTNQYGRQFRLYDYYSVVKMWVPASVDVKTLMADMQNINNGIRNYELVQVPRTTHSMEPDDGYWWDEYQFSLHSNTSSNRWQAQFANANIRILDAWKLSTGSSAVKVGVLEAGLIQFNHDDFTTVKNSIDYSVVKGGLMNGNVALEDAASYNFSTHSTQTAGVIGAIRDNGKGVAGIACGTGANLDGVSLYSGGGGSSEWNLYDEFGVHVINNSWIGGSPSTTHLEEGLDLYLAGVVRVSSRGNNGNDKVTNPSGIFPEFSISVGALGKDGKYYKPANSHSSNTEYSGYGSGIDVMAPGALDASMSTSGTYKKVTIDSKERTVVDFDVTDKYLGHPKTSGATPHVTGVVAMLIDYKYDHTNNINTLFPEDIERLLELGTIDIMNDLDVDVNADHIANNTPESKRRPLPTSGYDELTGWGKLDATYVMRHIEAPYYDIIHLSDQDNFEDVSITVGNSPIAADVITRMDNEYAPPNIHSFYKCDIYEVTVSVDFSNIIDNQYGDYSMFQLASYPEGGVWPLASYTNLLARERQENYKSGQKANYVSKKFPYLERTAVSKVNNTVTFVGYIYHLKEYAANSPTNFSAHNKWYPFNKTNASSKVEFGFSVHLVKDGVGVDQASRLEFSAYPNPFNSELNLQFAENNTGFRVQITDIAGREVYTSTVQEGMVKCSLDLTDLPKGAYMLRLSNGQRIGSQALIKQ